MKTMKFRKFALSSLTVLTLLASCSRDEDPAPKPDPKPDPPVTTITPDKINDFVWKAMNSWYYWQKEAPNLGDNLLLQTIMPLSLTERVPTNFFTSCCLNMAKLTYSLGSKTTMKLFLKPSMWQRSSLHLD